MGDLADLERQQRRAYWKGEQQAASRLVPFDPRNPLAGAQLEEVERIDQAVWEAEVMAQAVPELPVGPPTEGEQTVARENLQYVQKQGGEFSTVPMDEYLGKIEKPFLEEHGIDVWELRPAEQKALWYQWLREQEDRAGVERPPTRETPKEAPIPAAPAMKRQRKISDPDEVNPLAPKWGGYEADVV